MACGDKIKNNCAPKNFATCVFYEGYLPDYSVLLSESCVTTFETTEELYKTQEGILSEIDTSALGSSCITYDNAENVLDVKVKEVLFKLEEEICNLKQLESSSDDFSNCSLDYGTLVDPCNEPPQITNQCEFNQFVLDQLNTIING